jgi:hypothetical protein
LGGILILVTFNFREKLPYIDVNIHINFYITTQFFDQDPLLPRQPSHHRYLRRAGRAGTSGQDGIAGTKKTDMALGKNTVMGIVQRAAPPNPASQPPASISIMVNMEIIYFQSARFRVKNRPWGKS